MKSDLIGLTLTAGIVFMVCATILLGMGIHYSTIAELPPMVERVECSNGASIVVN